MQHMTETRDFRATSTLPFQQENLSRVENLNLSLYTFTCLFVQTSGYVMMRRGLFLLQKVLSNGPDPYIGIRTSTSSEPRQEFLIDHIIG